jgi:hypothetical protein
MTKIKIHDGNSGSNGVITLIITLVLSIGLLYYLFRLDEDTSIITEDLQAQEELTDSTSR